MLDRRKFCQRLCWLSAGALLSACATKPGPPTPAPPGPPSRAGRIPPTQRPYTINGRTYHPIPDAAGFSETGLASWYGPNFHGKKTSNGETYDMEGMTAAHKTLPMNTWVEVMNLDNGRKAVVRVNDRGPFVDGRCIDLSKAAARDLGVLGPGTCKVQVAALGYRKEGTGTAARPAEYVQPASYTEGAFTVQVGAFTNAQNAQRLAASLRPAWGEVHVVLYDRGDMLFHRVRVGRVENVAAARELEERLRAAGQRQAFAVAW